MLGPGAIGFARPGRLGAVELPNDWAALVAMVETCLATAEENGYSFEGMEYEQIAIDLADYDCDFESFEVGILTQLVRLAFAFRRLRMGDPNFDPKRVRLFVTEADTQGIEGRYWLDRSKRLDLGVWYSMLAVDDRAVSDRDVRWIVRGSILMSAPRGLLRGSLL